MRVSAAIAQQTLTTEAANVVTHSIGEAQRRGHLQVTPLHVASSLLTLPDSVLHRACIHSHLHSPHPSQSRALNLCFSVALDRLPACQTPHSSSPPHPPSLSHSLVAALKRAQAHQRRGCPEQQQVPLLAVKVEMEQLILSILDDPSVSRVMREAGFSSTLAKLSLKEAMGTSAPLIAVQTPFKAEYPASISYMMKKTLTALSKDGLPVFDYSSLGSHSNLVMTQQRSCLTSPFIPNLIQRSSDPAAGGCRQKDVNAVIDILLRSKRRNPVVVGQPSLATQAVVKELLQCLEKGELDQKLHKVKVVSPQFCTGVHCKEEMEHKFSELRKALDLFLFNGVIVYLGDLQWLLQGSAMGNVLAYNPSQHAAMELGRLLVIHGGSGKLWLMAEATSQTYMRCQACYPALEQQWGLQPISISSGSNAILSSRLHCLNSTAESSDFSLEPKPICVPSKFSNSLSSNKEDSTEELNCCPDCHANFEAECTLLQEQELTSNQESVHSCSSPVEGTGIKSQGVSDCVLMPSWLQGKQDTIILKEGACVQDLRRKWNHNCHIHHAEFHGVVKVSASLSHEPASSSSHKSGATHIDGRPLSKSLPQLSLGCNGGELDNTWLSLKPHRVQKCILSEINETLEDAVLEVSHMAAGDQCASKDMIDGKDINLDVDIAAEKGSNESCEERQENESLMLGHQKQSSELTVQTDLALGRSKKSLGVWLRESSERCGDRSAFLNQSLEGMPSSRKANFLPPPKGMLRPMPILPPNALQTSEHLDKLESQKFPGCLLNPDTSDALKGLTSTLEESFPWQKEAVHIIGSTVLQNRSGMGRRRGMSLKRDVWLLLVGPDQVGKRKVARALAKSVYGCENKLIWFCLNLQDLSYTPMLENLQPNVNSNMGSRGRSFLDKIVAAIRANPCCVLLLEGVDRADIMIRRELCRGMKSGKLCDSSGREVSMSSLIVIMTSSLGSNICDLQHKSSNKKAYFSEERIKAAKAHHIKLLIEDGTRPGTCVMTYNHLFIMDYFPVEKQGVFTCSPLSESRPHSPYKRKAEWNDPVHGTGDRKSKAINNIRGLELDLNLPVNQPELARESDEGISAPSPVLSPPVEESPSEKVLRCVYESLTNEFCSLCDEIVVFQPFKFDQITNNILDLLSKAVSPSLALQLFTEIDVSLVEHLVAATWEGRCHQLILEKWAEEVVKQMISSLITSSRISTGRHVQLVSEKAILLPEECFGPTDVSINAVSLLPAYIQTSAEM